MYEVPAGVYVGEEWGVGTIVAMVNGSDIKVLTGISRTYSGTSIGVIRMARDILRSVFTVVVLIRVSGSGVKFRRLHAGLGTIKRSAGAGIRIVRRSVFGDVREV